MQKTVGIIMTYNCAHLLEDTYKGIPLGIFDELIVVDDASKDNVAEVAQKLGLPFYTHDHTGYGGNLRYGLEKALKIGAEYMLEIHGDGQFDQAPTPLALSKMKEDDLDFLIGSRFTNLKQPLRDGMSLARYLANIGLSFIERIVLQIPWSEFHPGFRLYRSRFIKKLDLTKGANDYLFSFEIIALAAYLRARCGEIPVRADYHKEHTSVKPLRAAMNSFQEMWVLIQYIASKVGLRIGIFKTVYRANTHSEHSSMVEE